MTLREGMHSLVEGIVNATEARKTDLMSIRQKAHDHLGERHQAHQSVARKQRQDLTHEESQRKARVQEWLGEATISHQAMARGLRANLGRVSGGLAQEEARRSSQVQTRLGEMATDRKAAHAEWEGVVANHDGRKESVGVEGRGPVQESDSVRDRLLGHLSSHPDGLRLTEIEQEFGMNRFQSARWIKGLTDNGKVQRRGQLYFAV